MGSGPCLSSFLEPGDQQDFFCMSFFRACFMSVKWGHVSDLPHVMFL